MSQPASPIGSVEFIVKFDSMQGSFVDALKEAMKDVEIETGADPQLTSKIDEILDNLRNRLRGIWTGDRLQFLETAKPELKNIKAPETVTQVGLMGRNKELVERLDEESEEDWIKRSENMARDMLDNWALMVEKAIKDPDYWEQNKRRLVTYQGAMQSGLGLGNWERLSRDMFKQILKEFSMEEAFKKMAEKEGFALIIQKAMSKVPVTIDETQGEGEKKLIEDYTDLSNILAKKGIDPDEFQKAMSISPSKFKTLSADFRLAVNDILKDYIIPEATKIPNVILHIWRDFLEKTKEEFPIKGAGGIRPDLSFIVKNTKESAERARKTLEVAGVNEEKITEMLDKAKKAFGLEPEEEFGTKSEGMEVEIKIQETELEKNAEAKAEAALLLDKLKLLRSGIEGMTPEEVVDLEKEEAKLKEFMKEITQQRREILESTKQDFFVFVADFKNFAFEAIKKDIGVRYPKGTMIFDVQTIPNVIKLSKELFMEEEELTETIKEKKREVIKDMLEQIIKLLGGGTSELLEQWTAALRAAEEAGVDISKILKKD